MELHPFCSLHRPWRTPFYRPTPETSLKNTLLYSVRALERRSSKCESLQAKVNEIFFLNTPLCMPGAKNGWKERRAMRKRGGQEADHAGTRAMGK